MNKINYMNYLHVGEGAIFPIAPYIVGSASVNPPLVVVGVVVVRGVQYVHWVMHKCIMVKVGGKNTRKVCKKQVNL